MSMNEGNRPTWAQQHMATAFILAGRSTCAKRRSGAVACLGPRPLVNAYNGAVSGDDHCTDIGCDLDNGGECRGMHACVNLLVQASVYGVSLAGTDIYVTAAPCFDCVKTLAGLNPAVILFAEGDIDPRSADLADRLGITMVKMARSMNGWTLPKG